MLEKAFREEFRTFYQSADPALVVQYDFVTQNINLRENSQFPVNNLLHISFYYLQIQP